METIDYSLAKCVRVCTVCMYGRVFLSVDLKLDAAVDASTADDFFFFSSFASMDDFFFCDCPG